MWFSGCCHFEYRRQRSALGTRIYNHCGPGNVKIRVQYYYAERDPCVTPGETLLYANPNLGGLNFAYYIGGC
ncbi:DUF6355 family natural product biosynthesis protein [Paenarthrobacter nitroguajacolicus]|uniref:DUF6355 family natural product biosynthesis protein n=1 Tax=Paenarthrobacter nitroguajacolicus TaxID=211146 RepID=UPI0037C56581